MSQSVHISGQPITYPAPHDGRQYTLPHVVRSVIVQNPGLHESRAVLISLPKLSIQKDWQ